MFGWRYIAVLIPLICSAACYSNGQQSVSNAVAIGWLHGNCLAIKNPDLMPNSTINVFTPDGQLQIVEAEITGKTDSAENCPALLEDRRKINDTDGRIFYTVSTSTPIGMAIGVVAPAGGEGASAVNPADTNRNGITDTFYFCQTSEGIEFSIWEGRPYKGRKLWDDYYYLGYSSEPTCPAE